MSFSRSYTEIIKQCQNKNLVQMAINPMNEKHSKITDGRKKTTRSESKTFELLFWLDLTSDKHKKPGSRQV